MCRQRNSQFLEKKGSKIEDHMVTSLDFTVDEYDDVILSECPLCYCLKARAYIFVCGCNYVGLLCINCLDWLEDELFFCICYERTNYELIPLFKERISPLLQQKRLYLLEFSSPDDQ